VLESADLWEGDHASELSPMNTAPLRSILLERQMGARAVVVAGVGGEDPARVALVQNNEVIQALATERSAEALRVGVLPR
jgi:hypothetical protein